MDNLNLDKAKDIILEAIANQRWFFFENKPKVLMDKNTGILWANLSLFPYGKKNNIIGYCEIEATSLLNKRIISGFENWSIPTKEELKYILKKPYFPFYNKDTQQIQSKNIWWCLNKSEFISVNIATFQPVTSDIFYSVTNMFKFLNKVPENKEKEMEIYKFIGYLLPCNYFLIKKSNYQDKMLNKSYINKEKAQFTLNLFVENNLIPIFDDKEITSLYKKIYIEKSFLPAKSIKQQVQTVKPLKFNYEELLSKYNLSIIDKSVIKYYQSVQQWIDELLNKLDDFEQQKKDIIDDFNGIGIKLSKEFISNGNLTNEENSLLQKRQKFLQNKLSLDTNIIKRRLLAIREQADDVAERIEQINDSKYFFKDLAQLEKEDRPSFALVAEDMADILMNALQRINYIETNRHFATIAIDIWEQWTDDYKSFKTKDREELKNGAEQDGIDESIWQSWYTDWQKLRFNIEEKIQPALARGLKSDIPTEKENEITVIEQLIRCLEMYKEDIDKFYLEERKGIYQKYAFAPSGDLQDKFETESELYKRTAKFQSNLQEIIFSCTKTADRMFILKWAENLLDIQIDEIISFVADRDLQQISREVLQSFSRLKQKNYDAYLNDAKAYSKEKANREKQYNSLMFKMRSELNKQK